MQMAEEAVAVARDREPAEPDAENHDDDDAEPEGRQAEPGGAEGAHQAIGQAVAMPGGAWKPPRNIVVARAATVNMLMYSPRKNIAKRIEEYSVWKPATISPSPSARSKGSLLVSPTIVMT